MDSPSRYSDRRTDWPWELPWPFTLSLSSTFNLCHRLHPLPCLIFFSLNDTILFNNQLIWLCISSTLNLRITILIIQLMPASSTFNQWHSFTRVLIPYCLRLFFYSRTRLHGIAHCGIKKLLLDCILFSFNFGVLSNLQSVTLFTLQPLLPSPIWDWWHFLPSRSSTYDAIFNLKLTLFSLTFNPWCLLEP